MTVGGCFWWSVVWVQFDCSWHNINFQELDGQDGRRDSGLQAVNESFSCLAKGGKTTIQTSQKNKLDRSGKSVQDTGDFVEPWQIDEWTLLHSHHAPFFSSFQLRRRTSTTTTRRVHHSYITEQHSKRWRTTTSKTPHTQLDRRGCSRDSRFVDVWLGWTFKSIITHTHGEICVFPLPSQVFPQVRKYNITRNWSLRPPNAANYEDDAPVRMRLQ